VFDLQVRPHIDISGWDLCRANEDVSAVTSRTIDTNGVLPGVRCRAIERDFPSLAAVLSVRRPGSLVPAVFKALGYLGSGQRSEGH
jgi:hypothetical protein